MDDTKPTKLPDCPACADPARDDHTFNTKQHGPEPKVKQPFDSGDAKLKQLAADVLNGKVDPDSIPSGLVFIKIQNAAIKLGRHEVNKRMMEVSRLRLQARKIAR